MTKSHDGASLLRIIHVNNVYTLKNFPKFATICRDYRTKNTILTHGGDFLAPHLQGCIDGGKEMVKFMNLLKFDICCFGNHDSNVGLNHLEKRIDESKFTWLNSNVPALTPYSGRLPQYQIRQVGKHRIAFIGLLTADKHLHKPSAFGLAHIEDANQTAQTLIDYLKTQKNVDHVICLTHQNITADRELANTGLTPLILGGHSRKISLEKHSGTYIVKAEEDMNYVAVIDIKFSNDNSAPHIETQMLKTSSFFPDKKIQNLVKQSAKIFNGLGKMPLKKLYSVVLSSKNKENEENDLATLICTSWKEGLHADIALCTGSYIRGDKPIKKCVTLENLKDTLSFLDDLVRIELPGYIIKKMIKYSRDGNRKNRSVFLHTDKYAEVSDRGNLVKLNNKKLVNNDIYSVIISSFLINGGHNLEPLLQYVKFCSPPVHQEGKNIAVTVNSFINEIFRHLYIDNPKVFQQSHITQQEVKKLLQKYFNTMITDATLNVFFDYLTTKRKNKAPKENFDRIFTSNFTHDELESDPQMIHSTLSAMHSNQRQPLRLPTLSLEQHNETDYEKLQTAARKSRQSFHDMFVGRSTSISEGFDMIFGDTSSSKRTTKSSIDSHSLDMMPEVEITLLTKRVQRIAKINETVDLLLKRDMAIKNELTIVKALIEHQQSNYNLKQKKFSQYYSQKHCLPGQDIQKINELNAEVARLEKVRLREVFQKRLPSEAFEDLIVDDESLEFNLKNVITFLNFEHERNMQLQSYHQKLRTHYKKQRQSLIEHKQHMDNENQRYQHIKKKHENTGKKVKGHKAHIHAQHPQYELLKKKHAELEKKYARVQKRHSYTSKD